MTSHKGQGTRSDGFVSVLVWDEDLQIGQWSLDKNKDDPVKRITITWYYPVLLSSLTALMEKRMMNFADLLAVNQTKKKKIKLPLHPLVFFFFK